MLTTPHQTPVLFGTRKTQPHQQEPATTPYPPVPLLFGLRSIAAIRPCATLTALVTSQAGGSP
jgi:hypothetical protein